MPVRNVMFDRVKVKSLLSVPLVLQNVKNFAEAE